MWTSLVLQFIENAGGGINIRLQCVFYGLEDDSDQHNNMAANRPSLLVSAGVIVFSTSSPFSPVNQGGKATVHIMRGNE